MTDAEKLALESPEGAERAPPGTEAGPGDTGPAGQEERVAFKGVEKAPPAYDSLYGKIKAKHEESSGVGTFLLGVSALIFGTIGCSICIGLVLIVPITMLAIGATYAYDCPQEPYIPLYLIVSGCFAIASAISDIVQRCVCKENHNQVQPDGRLRINPIDGIVNCFLFAWFIAGNVWIYKTYGAFDPDPKSDHYCHPVLYWFAFGLMTSTYVIALIFLFWCCCCVCCVAFVCAPKKGRDSEA